MWSLVELACAWSCSVFVADSCPVMQEPSVVRLLWLITAGELLAISVLTTGRLVWLDVMLAMEWLELD